MGGERSAGVARASPAKPTLPVVDLTPRRRGRPPHHRRRGRPPHHRRPAGPPHHRGGTGPPDRGRRRGCRPHHLWRPPHRGRRGHEVPPVSVGQRRSAGHYNQDQNRDHDGHGSGTAEIAKSHGDPPSFPCQRSSPVTDGVHLLLKAILADYHKNSLSSIPLYRRRNLCLSVFILYNYRLRLRRLFLTFDF